MLFRIDFYKNCRSACLMTRIYERFQSKVEALLWAKANLPRGTDASGIVINTVKEVAVSI